MRPHQSIPRTTEAKGKEMAAEEAAFKRKAAQEGIPPIPVEGPIAGVRDCFLKGRYGEVAREPRGVLGVLGAQGLPARGRSGVSGAQGAAQQPPASDASCHDRSGRQPSWQ